LTRPQEVVLRAIINGATLKSHRHLDGAKEYKLHPLDGPAQTVRWEIVAALKEQGLIDSNKKFPAATYLLTEKGRQLAQSFKDNSSPPLTAKNY